MKGTRARRRICRTAIGRRMLHDPVFRSRAGLYQGMTANFLYAAFRADVGSPMIAQFSTESDGFRQSMNAMTGGVIWLAVILLAACMLRRSRKKEDSP